MHVQPEGIFLALGSNVGPRLRTLRAALSALEEANVDVVARSAVYETPALTLRPGQESSPFLNAVVSVRTTMPPRQLLQLCLQIEERAGRTRSVQQRWGPRTLDIDLLSYGSRTSSGDGLALPHPRLHERRFVLQPWADIAEDFLVPHPYEATVQQLLLACPDTSSLNRVASL